MGSPFAPKGLLCMYALKQCFGDEHWFVSTGIGHADMLVVVATLKVYHHNQNGHNAC